MAPKLSQLQELKEKFFVNIKSAQNGMNIDYARLVKEQ